MLVHLLPLTFLFIFISTFFILLAGANASRAEEAVVLRIGAIRNPRRSLTGDSEELELDEARGRGFTFHLGMYLRQYRFSASIEQLLLQADSRQSVGEFALLSLLSALITGFFTLLAASSPEYGLLASAGGLMLPWMYVANLRRRRSQSVMQALPDASDLMARAMRAGHSLTQAIEIMGLQAPLLLPSSLAGYFSSRHLVFRCAMSCSNSAGGCHPEICNS